MKKNKETKSKGKKPKNKYDQPSSDEYYSSGLLTQLLDKKHYPFKPFVDDFISFTVPFSNNQLNDLKRATIMNDLVRMVRDYAKDCSDPNFWELSSNLERKQKIKSLKDQSKDIKLLLDQLVPREAYKIRKSQSKRYWEKYPANLTSIVELIKAILQSKDYWLPSFKGKSSKKENAIEKFWKELFNTPYPEDIIDMDMRSTATVAMSIFAYREEVDFKFVSNIYYSFPARNRKAMLARFLESY